MNTTLLTANGMIELHTRRHKAHPFVWLIGLAVALLIAALWGSAQGRQGGGVRITATSTWTWVTPTPEPLIIFTGE